MFFPFLGREVSWGSHESRHALIAAEMVDSGDFLVPRRLGELYRNKPPVLHNAIALLYRVTGKVSMLQARIPSAIAGIVGALALYGIAMVLHDRKTAFFCGLGVLGIPGYVTLARIARPDMIFIATMLMAGWLWLCGMKCNKRGSRAMLFAVGGIAAGLSGLAKGPYGILFPLIVVALSKIRCHELRGPRPAEWIICAVMFVLPLALWAVPVYLRDHGVYLKRVILQPDLTTGGSIRARALYWYLGPAPLFFLPWTMFLPFVIADMRRRYWAAPYIALAILVVLSCVPGKRENYLGPWFPFAMLAVAAAITRRDGAPWVRVSSRILLGLSLLSMPLYYGWLEPRLSGPIEPERVFAEKVMEVVAEGSSVIGFRGMGEAVSFINYGRGRPHIVRVSETRDPDKLVALVNDALTTGRPCYVMVMNRDLTVARAALQDYRLVTIFEREVKKGEFWKLFRLHPP